jgi:hypothetical protein
MTLVEAMHVVGHWQGDGVPNGRVERRQKSVKVIDLVMRVPRRRVRKKSPWGLPATADTGGCS